MTAAASTGRIVLWLLGLLIVVAAIWLAYTMTGLQDVVPAVAVYLLILLVIGFGIMGAASQIRGSDRAPLERTERVERTDYVDHGTTDDRPRRRYDRGERL